ncbi:MAG: alpha/beta hydrolase [Anaerolineales bacterium]
MDKVFVIEGHQIMATLCGDPANPPVFMIHGWTSHRGVWASTISTLEGKYYCIAPDLLGHGDSDKPVDGDYSLESQAQRIFKLADQLGISRFSLIGHSMGGQIALYIASSLAPERVEKMVSVGGVVTGQLSEMIMEGSMKFIQNGRKWPATYELWRSLVNFGPLMRLVFRPWFFDMNCMPLKTWEADRLMVFNRACAIPYDEAVKSILATNLVEYLPEIKCPVLLIYGENDGTVPVEQAVLAKNTIPNNQLALIQKCGHFPMYEKPAEYLKALAPMFP